MKKICQSGLVILLVFGLLLPLCAPLDAAAVSGPSRVINVVYDDSGSMYSGTDLWSQAKYAIEVFAAMISDTDTLNVYLMSDFVAATPVKTPRLRLRGSSRAEANVREVHAMMTTDAQGTPFGPVRQAHDDLAAATADEKWLVVLTDGEFNDANNSAVNNYFQGKNQDVSVYFLAVGPQAAVINQDERNHVFFDHARTGHEVLNKITEMCTRIFNSNKLAVSMASQHIAFDIPMRELIVFAQGKNVSVNGIVDGSGTLIQCDDLVHVQYSTQPATNYPDAPYDSGLNGYVAIFSRAFPAGDYTLSVSGADTIEVYYKPDVEIQVYLTDEAGQEISESKIEADEYTLNFCFVQSGTTARLTKSELLGDIAYLAEVISDGVQHDKVYTQGDRILLAEGLHRIEAYAQYLEYNYATTSLVLHVFRDKAITFSTVGGEDAPFRLTEHGFSPHGPIRLEAQLDGQNFTDEQWARLGGLTASGGEGIAFRVEKGATGEVLIYPEFTGASRADAEGAVGQITARIEAAMTQQGDETWAGEGRFPVRIEAGYRDMVFTLASAPVYQLDKTGFVNGDEPIVMRARFADSELTADDWAAMTQLPTVSVAEGTVGDFRVEKGENIGEYAIYPTLYKDSVSKTEVADTELLVHYSQQVGSEVWSGAGDSANGFGLSVHDTRSWCERNRDEIIRWAIIGAIALLILGYVPPFKKYLPRSLKSTPTIHSTPRRPGPIPAPARGQVTRSLISKIIPYKAETGTIRFVPRGVGGAPALKVRALSGHSMKLLNARQYAGRVHILFNGDFIPEGTRTRPITVGVSLEVETDTMTYTCQPNA